MMSSAINERCTPSLTCTVTVDSGPSMSVLGQRFSAPLSSRLHRHVCTLTLVDCIVTYTNFLDTNTRKIAYQFIASSMSGITAGCQFNATMNLVILKNRHKITMFGQVWVAEHSLGLFYWR